MPTKELTSPLDRNGDQKLFKFGGGANTIIAKDVPDEGAYLINSGGGNDTVTGSSFDDTIFGGTGSDVISGGLGDDFIYGGEDAAGTDSAKGKNAVLESTLFGDVEFSTGMTVDFTGGTDHVFGSDGGVNDIYGDVDQVGYDFQFGDSVTFTGGNDELVGGDSDGTTAAENTLYGDSDTVNFSGTASGEAFVGGIDTMTGGSGAGTVNTMYGEATKVSGDGTFTGGADTMTGGTDAENNMYGDSARLVNVPSATGGDDTLHGGSGANAVNNMYGDFKVVTNSTLTGGADKIYAAAGATDNMYGDWDLTDTLVQPLGTGLKTGGADTFVIGVDGGTDTIFDFRVADQSTRPDINGDLTIIHETVVLDGFGFTEFSDLAGMWSLNGDDHTVLDLDATNDGAGDTVTFVGIADFNDLVDSFDFV